MSIALQQLQYLVLPSSHATLLPLFSISTRGYVKFNKFKEALEKQSGTE